MGRLVLPKAAFFSPVYIDTSILIYKIENIEPFLSLSFPLWEALEKEEIYIITSQLAYLETMVKPIQLNNQIVCDLYKAVLFETNGLKCISVSFPILRKATEIRAIYNLKTPDAIHIATAILKKASVFLTNDPAFKRVKEMDVIILKELLEK